MPRFCRMACRSVAKNAPLPGLSITGSPGCGIEFGNDVVAGLAAHQDAAHRTGVADAGGAAAADFLGRRQVGEVRAMALARVHHQQSGVAPRRQQPPVGLDGAAKLRHVVAEHFAEAARFQEVALHVDDQQRAMVGISVKEYGSAASSVAFMAQGQCSGRRNQRAAHTARRQGRSLQLRVCLSTAPSGASRHSAVIVSEARTVPVARTNDCRRQASLSAHRVAMNADPVCGMCTKTVLRR